MGAFSGKVVIFFIVFIDFDGMALFFIFLDANEKEKNDNPPLMKNLINCLLLNRFCIIHICLDER